MCFRVHSTPHKQVHIVSVFNSFVERFDEYGAQFMLCNCVVAVQSAAEIREAVGPQITGYTEYPLVSYN